jgi:hypothetical protein
MNSRCIGLALLSGVCGMSALAHADEFDFTARYYPLSANGLPECHTKTSGNGTAGSFVAAAMMGAEGFSHYMPPNNCTHPAPPATDFEDTLVQSCTSFTAAAGYASSVWPAACNPIGMAAALNAFPGLTNVDWVMDWWTPQNADPLQDPSRTAALNVMIGGLQSSFLRSPAVIPMFGQGDHWVTVVEIDASTGVSQPNTGPSGTYDINYVMYYDGGPAATPAHDGGFNPYPGAGLQMYGGSTFANQYYRVISNIMPHCSSNPLCTADPFYNKWVLLYEPPAGVPIPNVSANFKRSPGVGGTMNEHLAQILVWRSLFLSRAAFNAQVWPKIKGGVAGRASLVNAVFPSGAPWNYYLVPIMENATSSNAIAVVQLAADDGSFEGIHVLNTPVEFNMVTRPDAEDIARGTLVDGERLGPSALTWNPTSHTGLNKSASQPYFEFRVLSGANTDAGVVRVMLDSGAVERASE